MSNSLVLAIDQGTTNTKGVLVADTGAIVYRTSAPVALHTPRSDWVEGDATEIWRGVLKVLAECFAVAGSRAIAGIGISNQRESVVLWDRDSGNPVAPVVIWQCRRSLALSTVLASSPAAESVRNRTGLAIDPLFSATKLAWLLENIPGTRARAEAGELCFGTIDSWLLWKLTGGAVHATDRSNASRTQLFNIHSADWDPDLLAIFGIPAAVLPRLCASSEVLGQTIALPGVPAGVAIASLIGDSHAALLGQGAFSPGLVKATYGTGTSLMSLGACGNRSNTALAHTVAWEAEGRVQHALEGNITMTGAVLQWLGQFLERDQPVASVLQLASRVTGSDGVYLVPAMHGLGAPYWDSRVQGAVYGLQRTSTLEHLAFAAVESIAFQVAEVFDQIERCTGTPMVELHADGGASANPVLMQMQADLLGKPVYRSECAELSALGAAMLAGVALGVWPSLSATRGLLPAKVAFLPQVSTEERHRRRAGWRLAIARTRLQADESNVLAM